MKKLLLTLLQVDHRVEVITDSPNKTTSTAAADSANDFKAGTVSNDNFFCKPASSGNGPPLVLQYHLSQKSDQQGLSQESTQQEEASPHLKHFVSVKSTKESVLEAMRKQFYAIYGKIHQEKVQAGYQLMYKTTYDKIVAVIINYNKAEVKDTFMRNAKRKF